MTSDNDIHHVDPSPEATPSEQPSPETFLLKFDETLLLATGAEV